ncbi:MAG: carbon starvation protein A [Firmicutes bacterium]|nr:carbon starvation protein A [Bacillota bacterium]
MNGITLLLIGIAVLVCGYIFYGRWLCKQWGVGESTEATPAHTLRDDVDYVPAPAPVLMGHHFSSIAGAGPITGPINAAAAGFGWGACVLWILIGGIFFGGPHDFGALFASVRHNGKSIGEIISANMSLRAKRLFVIFAYLTLILVVAAFSAIVASTFGVTYDDAGALTAAGVANAQVAMVSLMFIIMAIVFGFAVYRKGVNMKIASVIGVIGIVICIAIGLNFYPIQFSTTTWMWLVGAYIMVASVAPVWILLQPRDYLSSFLLYAMLALAALAVFMGNPSMDTMPLIDTPNNPTPVFPVLFTTIACGAISGFHSLVGSGTTSKQLDKEKDAKPIAYGGMLIECVLAIMTLIAVAHAYSFAGTDLAFSGATQIFGGGIASMIDPSRGTVYSILYTLLVLTYSTFCLTSLDTATRMGRFMFQELFLDGTKGETPQNVTGYKKVLSNPYVATAITVVLGIGLGMNGYSKIWALFGSANQLLAALALLAIAAWLANIGRKSFMCWVPMFFMLAVTVFSLIINTKTQFAQISAGGADWGPYVQAILGVIMIVLALVLAYEGVKTIFFKKHEAAK